MKKRLAILIYSLAPGGAGGLSTAAGAGAGLPGDIGADERDAFLSGLLGITKRGYAMNLQSERKSKIKYRADIDGLRAVAVLGVLAFHVGSRHFTGGFVGVDVFFVISGFLITGIIKQEIESTGTFSALGFYARRIRRLFPAMLLVLFFTSLFAIFVFSPTHMSRFGGALSSAIASVSNIYFWIETDYFDISAKFKPLLHTWSLGIEEQFYFIWPLIILLLLKTEIRWLPPTVLFFIGALSLYLNVVFGDGHVRWLTDHYPTMAKWIEDGKATIFFLLPFRVFEFVIGALMVWLIHYKVHQWVYDFFLLSGLVLIGYAMHTYTDKLIFPSFYGLVPTLGAALVIYAGHASRFRILLANKTAVGLGLISYSLYLIHWPIIAFWNYLNGGIGHVAAIGILVVSVFLAVISYLYIEQPFRKCKYNLANSQWKYPTVAVTSILFAIGLHMKYSDGWAWRMPDLKIVFQDKVVFQDAGNAKNFHKKFYGGVGYFGFYPKKAKKVDIVLMGDSHGRHYAYGLDKLLVKDRNMSMYVARCSSSIYLPYFVRIDNPNNLSWSKKVLSEVLPIIKNSNGSIVILSESWLSQIERADILDRNGNRMNKKVTIDDIVRGILSLKKMIGKENKLVIIGNVPKVEYNLYDIFSRPHSSEFSPDKYLKSKRSMDVTAFNEKLKRIADETKEFIFLDPQDILCSNDWCRNVDDKKRLIYSDNGHLSIYGSEFVIRGFLPKLTKLIPLNKAYSKDE